MANFNWVNRDLFPFESKFITIDGAQIHYIDEGSGPVLLFAHGTPEWSFGWRDVIKPLRHKFRCIAPDMLGMGLSDKPQDADYTPRAHAERLEKFIAQLGLQQINIVANDFGLAIALSYAIKHPDKVLKISIFNGWMWRLDTDPHFARPARMFAGGLGRFVYRYLNFPVNVLMPAAFGNKKKYLPREIHRHYKLALPDYEARVATYAFAKAILESGDWWDSLWEKRAVLSDKISFIFWGMKDSLVPVYELEKWRAAFPAARVIECAEAGHFVQEEAPETMVQVLMNV